MLNNSTVTTDAPIDLREGTLSPAELAAIFDGCRDKAYQIALHITSDPEEAADLVQEAYLRARRGLGRFRGEASVETWLLRIVVNLSLKIVRRRRLRQRLRHLVPLPRSRPNPDWLLQRSDELRRLDAAMEQLPARQRAAFVLRYAHELSMAEVAELLDLAVPTVKTHLRRAVERLRREMKRMGHKQ